jgi:hypothetical protein
VIIRFFSDRRRFFATRSWWSFLLCLSLEKHVVFLTAASIWMCFAFIGESRVRMIYMPSLGLLAKNILFIPLMETLVFQCLIIETARRLNWTPAWRLVASILLFTSSHFVGGGISHGLLSGALGGYYLAFTYLTYRDRSLIWAFAMTLTFHSLHNLLTAVERAVRYGG